MEQPVRDVLRLCRAQTVPLEAVPALLGALLATGGELTLAVVAWGLYGVLYHMSGYGMNSFLDWVNGFDKDDGNKQHHPLNRDMDPETASAIVYALFLTTYIWGGVGVSIHGSWSGAIVLHVGVVCGVLYNVIGKATEHKYIFIAIAHSTVFLLPYIAISRTVDEIAVLGTLSIFLWVTFQITFSGELKDLNTEEENILKKSGLELNTHKGTEDPWATIPSVISLAAIIQRFLFTGVVGTLAIALGAGVEEVALITIIGGITMYLSLDVAETGWYIRKDVLRHIAMIEIGSFSMFVIATLPVIGEQAGVLLISSSAVYLFITNKLLWGTLIAPEV